MRKLFLILTLAALPAVCKTLKNPVDSVAMSESADNLVAVANQSDKDITGLVVRYVVDGIPHVKVFANHAHDEYRPLIAAGRSVLVGPRLVGDESIRADMIRWNREQPEIDAQVVSVDLVVFADGSHEGPDTSNAYESFFSSEEKMHPVHTKDGDVYPPTPAPPKQDSVLASDPSVLATDIYCWNPLYWSTYVPSPAAQPSCDPTSTTCTQKSFCMNSITNTLYRGPLGTTTTSCSGTCSTINEPFNVGGQAQIYGTKSVAGTNRCVTSKGKSLWTLATAAEVYSLKGCGTGGVASDAGMMATTDVYCGTRAYFNIGVDSPYSGYTAWYWSYCDGGSILYLINQPPPTVLACMTPVAPTIVQ